MGHWKEKYGPAYIGHGTEEHPVLMQTEIIGIPNQITKTGTIMLGVKFSINHYKKVDIAQYTSIHNRRETIKKWKRKHNLHMKDFWISINPDINEIL